MDQLQNQLIKIMLMVLRQAYSILADR